VTHFAAALVRTERGWTGSELDLGEVEDLEALADVLRDLVGDGDGPALLVLEEDDEYLAVVRVDGGSGSLDEPRVFLSDERAPLTSALAAMLWEEEADLAAEDDEDATTAAVATPVGDTGVLADLGTPADDLLALCAEEGLLPADVLTALAERAGAADALESLREG
jgi:putative tRNA adenosine deaminase-associated protein